jgi:hypothetical protein
MLMVGPVCPQLRKCRVRPDSYAWCQQRKVSGKQVGACRPKGCVSGLAGAMFLDARDRRDPRRLDLRLLGRAANPTILRLRPPRATRPAKITAHWIDADGSHPRISTPRSLFHTNREAWRHHAGAAPIILNREAPMRRVVTFVLIVVSLFLVTRCVTSGATAQVTNWTTSLAASAIPLSLAAADRDRRSLHPISKPPRHGHAMATYGFRSAPAASEGDKCAAMQTSRYCLRSRQVTKKPN